VATATPRPDDLLARLEAALAATGLVARGRLAVTAEDGLPPLPDGRPARTLVLVGRVGRQGWSAFAASPESRDRRPDPLDRWSARVIGETADLFGAAALFPFAGPPWWPLQRWAMRAEPVYPSPLGVLIHPTFGLWHAYRAALALPGVLTLPPQPPIPHPCTSCHEKPCLAACPVAALGPDGYDVPHCAAHVRAAAGRPCREFGCAARRACPVGQSYRYPPDQAAFHMQGFLARLPAADGTEQAAGAE